MYSAILNAGFLTSRARRLDNAEQPENEDQDQQTAKTDIHCTLLYLYVGRETGTTAPPFPPLRLRHIYFLQRRG
jgi:hypothetical protein